MCELGCSLAEGRFKLSVGSYPFESHFQSVDGASLHYVDEGAGPAVFLLHGNPSWSFLYRKLINDLRTEFRCIAVDLAGFGLSQAEHGFSFKPEAHARLIANFLDALDVRGATLIAHDWGGPIGLGAMTLTEARITRVCLGNTWAWPVNGDFHFEWFSRLMGGPVGRFGATRFAFFINVLMPASMKRRNLTAEEMAAYRAPFADGRPRTPMHVFPWEITSSGPWLGALAAKLAAFDGPAHFIWPANDIAFRKKELARWLALWPHATHAIIDKCGHYLWEDAPDECLSQVRSYLSTQLAAGGGL